MNLGDYHKKNSKISTLKVEPTQQAAVRFIAKDYRTTTPGLVTDLLKSSCSLVSFLLKESLVYTVISVIKLISLHMFIYRPL